MNRVGPLKIRSGVSVYERWTWRVLLVWLAVLLLALWYFRGSAREIRGQRLGTVRRGTDVSIATLSPDARLAYIADGTPGGRVCHIDGTMPMAEWSGLPFSYTTAWSPEKPWLAIDLSDGMGVYHFSGQRAQGLWQFNQGSVRSADWSPDGQRLAVASTTWIRILEAATGRIVYEWPAGVMDIHDPLVAWSPDGRRLAVTGSAGLVVLDCESGREVKRSRGSGWPSQQVAWSPDSQLLAVREADDPGFPSSINIYRADTGRRLQRFHCWNIPRLAEWSPDGKLLLIGAKTITSYPGSPVLAVMNARSGRYVARLASSGLPWVGARWTPGANTVTAIRKNGEVWRWKLPSGLGDTRSPAF